MHPCNIGFQACCLCGFPNPHNLPQEAGKPPVTTGLETSATTLCNIACQTVYAVGCQPTESLGGLATRHTNRFGNLCHAAVVSPSGGFFRNQASRTALLY